MSARTASESFRATAWLPPPRPAIAPKSEDTYLLTGAAQAGVEDEGGARDGSQVRGTVT